MKRDLIITLLFLFLLTGCGKSYEDGRYEGYEYGYEQGLSDGEEYGYEQGYSDGIHSNDVFDFLDKNSFYCCFCDTGDIIEYRMINFTVNDELYYMCPECATSYFKNIAEMIPCYYCVSCGELTDSNEYVHSWTNGTICKYCISNYQQCSNCDKYDSELQNSICGICGNY